MDIIQVITQELKVEKWQVEAAVKLIDEGNTIPFISRYRKEATGSLNDEQLRTLYERLSYLRNLEDKKNQVLKSIEDQGKLTAELKKQILDAQTLVVVEDLYRPYRPKRRTRATIAKEKGLEPLADIILQQMTDKTVEEEAEAYVSEEKGVKNVKEALNGAKDIIAERISDEADYRIYIRNLTAKNGSISSTAKDPEAQSVYEMYYDFEEPVKKLAGHRILALNRGEKEKFITVKVNAPEEDILRYLNKRVITGDNPNTTPILKEVTEDSYKRLIGPAIEREIRSDLTDKAEDGAIHVFGKNLEQLLMQPPIAGKVVLGWDPAFRTGCKLAVVDATGKVLDTTVVYPTAPTTEKKIRAAKDTVEKMIDKYGVSLISVGNGTACRESEQVIVDMLKEIPEKKVLFANPALPAVQDHEIAIFKEVAQKYDFDGLLLDRGRYDNIQSDFSDFSRGKFEAYIGKKLERFPEDIYTWEEDGDGGWKRIDGPYFKQWIEWRASVIYDFFKRTKEELKAVKPGLKFGAYTGAWYPSYFEVGVNWASNTYDPSQDFAWATPDYKNYGYAELLDIFTNGNYYWNVTVDEYRRSNGLHKNETDSEMSKGDHLSVEGGCRYSRRLLGGRPFFGGMYVEDYKRDTTQFKRAVEMNLRESDGLMVFDIVHIINRDWWGPLQRAVSAYEAEAKQ